MNIFVTGGAGFLGRYIVEELSRKGCTPSFSARRLSALTCEDLKGFDAVIHTAALKPGPYTEAEFRNVNAEGTRHLVEACVKAGVTRFVHISSMAVGADRDDPYSTSKKEAEQHVQASGLHWTIVRPGAIYGLSDWWISYLRLMKHKRLIVVIGDGEHPMHQIYVKDCATAIVDVVRREEPARRIYYASAEPITYNHCLAVLKASLGAGFHTVHIPLWAGRMIAAGMKHVLRSPKPHYAADPRKNVTTESGIRLKCAARTFDVGLAEVLSELFGKPQA